MYGPPQRLVPPAVGPLIIRALAHDNHRWHTLILNHRAMQAPSTLLIALALPHQSCAPVYERAPYVVVYMFPETPQKEVCVDLFFVS